MVLEGPPFGGPSVVLGLPVETSAAYPVGMSTNEDLMRAVKEIGQEFGKIADQAGTFVREAAHQVGGWAGKVPGIGKDGAATGDPIEGIRRLGELRDAGLVTEDEFQAKKQQLLDRI